MTNPSPRPALRKAADAEVHPAAPRPARSPRARADGAAVSPVPAAAPPAEPAAAVPVAAPAPLKPPKKRHADAARTAKPTKRKFSGSTSDHLRVPDVPEAGNGSAQRSALDALFDGEAAPAPTPAAPAADRPKDRPKKAKKPAGADLMGGKPVDLGATVPKALRKAVRDEAKRRGLDVDAVVTDLLHAWVTEPR